MFEQSKNFHERALIESLQLNLLRAALARPALRMHLSAVTDIAPRARALARIAAPREELEIAGFGEGVAGAIKYLEDLKESGTAPHFFEEDTQENLSNVSLLLPEAKLRFANESKRPGGLR